LEIIFGEKLRDEKKFGSLAELREQIFATSRTPRRGSSHIRCRSFSNLSVSLGIVSGRDDLSGGYGVAKRMECVELAPLSCAVGGSKAPASWTHSIRFATFGRGASRALPRQLRKLQLCGRGFKDPTRGRACC